MATNESAGPLSSKRSKTRATALRELLRGLFRILRANPLTLIGFILVVIISVTAALVVLVPAVTQVVLGHPVLFTPYDLNGLSTEYGQAPSGSHLLGTDNLGRDMFSRILAALPLDLAIGFGIAGFALLVGSGLGLVAGYWDNPRTFGGVVSVVIMRVTDIFLAFPSLVLALAIAASLGRGTVPSMLAGLLTWWPYYVRLTRGEVLAIKHQPYVVAARAAGTSETRILFRHVLRNLIEPLLVYYTLDIGTVIVTFSTISFVGIGVPLDVPEWGTMVESYERFLLTLPWTVLSAGAAIFVTVLAFSLFGDGLRDILVPRGQRPGAAQVETPTSPGDRYRNDLPGADQLPEPGVPDLRPDCRSGHRAEDAGIRRSAHAVSGHRTTRLLAGCPGEERGCASPCCPPKPPEAFAFGPSAGAHGGCPRPPEAGSDQRSRDDLGLVSPRALRRNAPADHDRHRAERQAFPADRRRAHERPRHHDSSASAHPHEGTHGRGPHVDLVHQP